MRFFITLCCALIGFAVYPSCFYHGTRAKPKVDVPSKAPAERGGQYMDMAPPHNAKEKAEAALLARGWEVHPSSKSNELIGKLFANIAYIRWHDDYWWVKVDQRSSLNSNKRVPRWDHPWEALRLLHLCSESKQAARGWSQWQREEEKLISCEEMMRLIGHHGSLTDKEWMSIVYKHQNMQFTEDELRIIATNTIRINSEDLATIPSFIRELYAFKKITGNPVYKYAVKTKQDPYTHFESTSVFYGAQNHRRPWYHQQENRMIDLMLLLNQMQKKSQSMSRLWVPPLSINLLRMAYPDCPSYVGDDQQLEDWWETKGKDWFLKKLEETNE